MRDRAAIKKKKLIDPVITPLFPFFADRRRPKENETDRSTLQ